MVKLRSSTHNCTTVIWFWVRVPVLSEQMTLAAPRVSTEASRRMRACRRTISRMPIARVMVTTAGKPSRPAAIARPPAHQEHQGADDQAYGAKLLAQLVQALLERRRLGVQGLQHLGDQAHLRVHPR